MVLPPSRPLGGFKRKPGRENWKRPGIFIATYLSNGPAEGHEIYTAYKANVRSEPTREYFSRAHRSLRKRIAHEKRLETKQKRVKVYNEEIEARMPSWLADHPFKGNRHCCSYNSFMHYLYIARQLGLVEYTGQKAPASGKAGSGSTEWHESHPAVYVHLVGSPLDPAWENLWLAYQASTS